jgi:hypothetical protein
MANASCGAITAGPDLTFVDTPGVMPLSWLAWWHVGVLPSRLPRHYLIPCSARDTIGSKP